MSARVDMTHRISAWESVINVARCARTWEWGDLYDKKGFECKSESSKWDSKNNKIFYGEIDC